MQLYRDGVPPSRILTWARVIAGDDAAIERMTIAFDLSAEQVARMRAHRGSGEDSYGIPPAPRAKPADWTWLAESTASTIASYTFTAAAGEQRFARPNLTLRWWELARGDDRRWLAMIERDGAALAIDEHAVTTRSFGRNIVTDEHRLESLVTASSPFRCSTLTDAAWVEQGREWMLPLGLGNVTWTLRVTDRCRLDVRIRSA